MTSNRFLWVAMLVLAGLTGCAMCDNSQDGTYPAFGGKWQRDNPSSGRVASLFDPAGHHVETTAAWTEATPAPEDAEPEDSAERLEPSPENGEAAESTLERPADRDSTTMDGAEAAKPETDVEPDARGAAKPAAEQDAPEAGLALPAPPGERSKMDDRQDRDANLLPPLELPPQP